MPITSRQLAALGVPIAQAKAFAEPLSAACALHAITTPARISAFLAQCLHESARFTKLREDMYYRDAERVARLFRSVFDEDRDRKISQAEIEAARPYTCNPERLANRVYANRYGNGDEASGDGFRYRAGGLIGTTFRDNYREAGQGTGRPYEAQPELLASPPDASLAAAFFFASRGCIRLADAGQFSEITRVINPGMAGVAERLAHFEGARKVFA
jgi:putative chitinase